MNSFHEVLMLLCMQLKSTVANSKRISAAA